MSDWACKTWLPNPAPNDDDLEALKLNDRLLKREVEVLVLLVCGKPLSSERNCRFCPTISGTVLKTGMKKLQGFGGFGVILGGVVSR